MTIEIDINLDEREAIAWLKSPPKLYGFIERADRYRVVEKLLERILKLSEPKPENPS